MPHLELVQAQKPQQQPSTDAAVRLRRQSDAYAERAIAFGQALRLLRHHTPEYRAVAELWSAAMETHERFHQEASAAEREEGGSDG